MKYVKTAKKAYFKHLIEAIGRKEKETIDGILKSGSYSPVDILDEICFYEKLKEKCAGMKPGYYVKTIVLISDGGGSVISVGFEYFERGERISDPALAVHPLLTDISYYPPA